MNENINAESLVAKQPKSFPRMMMVWDRYESNAKPMEVLADLSVFGVYRYPFVCRLSEDSSDWTNYQYAKEIETDQIPLAEAEKLLSEILKKQVKIV